MVSDSAEVRDKVTVGLTPRGNDHLAKVLQTGWFTNDLDAYRVAIAVALAQGLISSPDAMTGVKTKYNLGSLDPDGKMKLLIGLLAPEDASHPYESAERRADAGLQFLSERLVDQNVLLSDLLLGSSNQLPKT